MKIDSPGVSIEVENVSLFYPLLGGMRPSLRQALAERLWFSREFAPTIMPLAALNGISFNARDGDRIALVGANGAGKTTLLRVLSGIYTPDTGRVAVKGRLLPFFGHLPGLSPDATGLENVRLSALSMGIAPGSIPELIEDVEKFTQLGRFMKMPLRAYSSGMSTRLLFAIATALTAEVFIFDEFSFAAGDRFFRERAQERAIALMDRAKTVIIATHDEGIVRGVCNKAILLHQGKVVAIGTVNDVLKEYAGSGTQDVERP